VLKLEKATPNRRCLKYFYTKLVFFNTALLIAPRPNANNAPPAAQRTRLSAVEPRGVIIETIINRSIPPPSEPHFYASLTLFMLFIFSLLLGCEHRLLHGAH